MSYAYFSKFYDTLTSNIPYRTRGEYFHAILKQNPPPGPILLDLACGTGSLSEVMASLSYDVIGVDSSEEMLMEAMNKKYDSGLDILYLCQDMTALGSVALDLAGAGHLEALFGAGAGLEFQLCHFVFLLSDVSVTWWARAT